MSTLPETGFLKISAIIGDENAVPPIPALIPVKKSTWWKGCADGRFPKPVKIGKGRGTFWRIEDIKNLIASV